MTRPRPRRYCKRLAPYAIATFLSVLMAGRGHAQSPSEAWGVRLGILSQSALPGVRPLIEPFYETTTASGSPLTMMVDLTLAYVDLSSLQFPSYDEHTIFDYGFHGGLRYAKRFSDTKTLSLSGAFGFDVFPDPVPPEPGYVSASFPITASLLHDLSHTVQLELAATARPVWYFRQAWGFSYSITIGGRFPSF